MPPANGRDGPGSTNCLLRSLAILPAVLVAIPAFPAAARTFLGAHDGLDCAQCHIVDDGGAPAPPDRLVAAQELFCTACHENYFDAVHANGHPSGFVPARPLPRAYRPDGEGRFTCSSCHGLHDDTPGLLRSSGRWACEDCH